MISVIRWSSLMVATPQPLVLVKTFLKYDLKNKFLLCGITRKPEYFLCLILLQLQTLLLGYVNFSCSMYKWEKKTQPIVQNKLQTLLLLNISSSVYEAWSTCFCLFCSHVLNSESLTGPTPSTIGFPSLPST